MKSLPIKSRRGKNTIASLINKKVKNYMTIFRDAPTVEMEEVCPQYTLIRVFNEHSHMLTFAEIDNVREAVDPYIKNHRGDIYYTMQTKPYLGTDGETWLSMPVMEITVRVALDYWDELEK